MGALSDLPLELFVQARVVDRDRVIDGSGISQGDAILGLASSGCHSNGFSLVRRIVDSGVRAGRLDLRAENSELNTSLAAALLAPTRIYVKPLLHVMRDFTLKGLVHITGGGFPGNVPRILPRAVRARIDTRTWPRPALFDLLQREGSLSDEEMLRVFNCGIGMLVIVAREQANDTIERLQALGERAYRIGEIEAKQADESPVFWGELETSDH